VFGDTTVITKVIDGTYPNYRQVIPNIAEKDGVDISRVELLAALKRSALLDENCILQFRGQMLTVSARGKDIGECVETIMIPKYKNLTISFRSAYLIDALDAVPDDQVRFYAEDRHSPGLFKIGSRTWLNVTMPMRSIEEQEKQAAEQAAKAQPPEAPDAAGLPVPPSRGSAKAGE